MGIGRDEILKGVGASVVAFYLLRKLAKDIGREAERIGQRSMKDSGKHVEAVASAAMAAIRAESDRILDKSGERIQCSVQHMAATSRLNCKLQGASLLCEVEPKELIINSINGG